MSLLLWAFFFLCFLSACGHVERAVKPRMSRPVVDGCDAMVNIGLALLLLWAIAREWALT